MLTHIVTTVLNRLADRTVWTRQQLRSHTGKSVCFRVESLIDVNIVIGPDGYFDPVTSRGTADMTLNIPPGLLPRLAANDVHAFREIAVSGDPGLAEILLYMGKALHDEVEEDLSALIGDILARRIALTGQGLAQWHMESVRNISQALARFLTEEQPTIASKTQLHRLTSEVNSLQQHILRLEERILTLAAPQPSPTEAIHLSQASR